MPENVPPKETAAMEGKGPTDNTGAPRPSIAGPAAEVPAGMPGSAQPVAQQEVPAVDNTNLWGGGVKRLDPPRTGPRQVGDPIDHDNPGEGFVRIKWLKKIGGHEEDEEWCEERRAHNLVASGHAEIVKDEKK